MRKIGLKTVLPIVFAFFCSLALSLLFNQTGIPVLQNKHWGFSILFLALLFGITLIIMAIPAGDKENTQKILAMSVARLLIALVFFLCYVLLYKTNARSFSMHFVPHFVFFLTFDTLYLIKKISKP